MIYSVVIFFCTKWLNYIYIYFFFKYSFLLWLIAGYWIWFPVLYTRTLLFIQSLHNSFHLLTPNSYSISLPVLSPAWQPQVCSLSVSLCFIDRLICVIDSTRKWSYVVFVFLCLTSLSMRISRSILELLQMGLFHASFYSWVVFHCIYVPYLFYPLICQLTFRLLPCLAIVNSAAMNIGGVCIFLNYSFVWIYAQEWNSWIIWQLFSVSWGTPTCSP